ncbi:peptidoglycan D,D-transpeptidase FtsI family protein [Fictibacillus phosphorivorans]|uniref:peptidoglycan D,D-transpeptidase FtsI family protein n=1 Tax=Fictibacillus phosphorivorans TaxID=1221500 RepID=UPI00204064D7|nr:penicillin-binding protein 2 [Fictibacillus phosphorivorans]MCM3716954.1 penicillin-binding protein 2 [Fictibacillus phosphorivorans]MCM3774497.1 penicillin-binding protein 2 [Fictibacillus phosphorivorans]
MLSRKRTIAAGVIILISIIGLIYRLADIQLISTKSFSKNHVNLIEESVNQRTHRFTINDGRGYFLDRNGELLSTDVEPQVVVFPSLYTKDWPVNTISNILHIPSERIENMILSMKKPAALMLPKELTLQQMNQINELEIPGLYAQLVTKRKPLPFANHVIGAVGEDPDLIKEKYRDKLEKGTISTSTKTGKNGMQFTFDPFLISEGETQFIYHVDRQGNPLFGLDVKYRAQTNPLYPLHVTTTIDKKMQEAVEKYLSEHELEAGGAVLLDVETSELLAMASRPVFNSETIYKHENKMTSHQIPGSIFKIVTAAASIEKNKVQNDTLYDCNVNIYGKEDERKLGMLNFEDSFAQSCNKTFGDLANEMAGEDPDFIEDYASKLGLLDLNGWRGQIYHYDDFSHFYQEERGQIRNSNKKIQDYQSPLAISQTAIGQLDVKITPLAAANMMATIARGGEWSEVKAAKSVNFANGTELVAFKDHMGQKDSLSPYTIMRLQSLLVKTVRDEKGTGHTLQSLPFQVAGKTGTAQKGDKSNVFNKWFAGYFPADKPKFALVVVDMKHGTLNRTMSVYADIAKRVMEISDSQEED